jgi:pimeloyl-ACP methyl ester carboxylesterase
VARDGKVRSGGVLLHYREWGTPTRRPLLFLHGGSAHARWWDFVVAHLGEYRCLALDLRGHGDSGWPDDGDYRLDTHAGDVAAVVEALALDHVCVIGHSFGGFVAMRYAARREPRLAALVVVDSRARIGARSARLLDALRKIPQPRYASLEQAIQRFRLLPSASTAPPEILAHVARYGMTRLPDGIWTLKFDRRALASTPAQDFAPALATITCPILAVRGANSEIVSRAALDEFRAAAPHAQTAEIAAAHHHVLLDQPRALAEAIHRFCASLPAP